MQVTTQYLPGEKKAGDAIQLVLTPDNQPERSLLGALYMLGAVVTLEVDSHGALALMFSDND